MPCKNSFSSNIMETDSKRWYIVLSFRPRPASLRLPILNACMDDQKMVLSWPVTYFCIGLLIKHIIANQKREKTRRFHLFFMFQRGQLMFWTIFSCEHTDLCALLWAGEEAKCLLPWSHRDELHLGGQINHIFKDGMDFLSTSRS